MMMWLQSGLESKNGDIYITWQFAVVGNLKKELHLYRLTMMWLHSGLELKHGDIVVKSLFTYAPVSFRPKLTFPIYF